MKININKSKFTLTKISIKQVADKKNPNLLAYASLTFKDEDAGEYFVISGFTVWKSKYEGYNVEVPKKPSFQYCLFEKSLWRKIKKEIIDRYIYESIPIIEEDKQK